MLPDLHVAKCRLGGLVFHLFPNGNKTLMPNKILTYCTIETTDKFSLFREFWQCSCIMWPHSCVWCPLFNIRSVSATVIAMCSVVFYWCMVPSYVYITVYFSILLFPSQNFYFLFECDFRWTYVCFFCCCWIYMLLVGTLLCHASPP